MQIFWNSEEDKCNMKVTRVGQSREYLAKFYRVEEKNLVSYLKHFPYEMNFKSFEAIATDSVNQR